MPSQRQQQFARLLQRELGDILQRDFRHVAPGRMLTITDVEVTPDLQVARVYLSALPVLDKPIARLFDEDLSALRGELGKRIRNQVRKVPELRLFDDKSGEHADQIDKVLRGLDIPPADPDEDSPEN